MSIKYTLTKLVVLVLFNLLSGYALAQNLPNLQERPQQANPCVFRPDQFIIGNTYPSLGSTETYTLQNVSQNEEMTWKVAGAKTVDGINVNTLTDGLLTKFGNSINVVWDNNSPQQDRIEVVRTECLEDWVNSKKKDVYPGGNGNGPNNFPCPTPEFEISEDNGLTWSTYSSQWDTTHIKNCHTANGCFYEKGYVWDRTFYAGHPYLFRVNVNIDKGAVHDTDINPNDPLGLPDGGCSDASYCVEGVSYSIAYSYVSSSHYGEAYIGPWELFDHSQENYDYGAWACTGVVTATNNLEYETQFVKVIFHEDKIDTIVKVTFSGADCGIVGVCGNQGVTRYARIVEPDCSELISIEGPDNIRCSQTQEVLEYTVTGGGINGTFFWDLPAGWVSLDGIPVNPLIEPGNFDYKTTKRSIKVATNGIPGQLRVKGKYFGGACPASFETLAIAKNIGQYNDLGEMNVSVPSCAASNETNVIPPYRVENGGNSINYTWKFYHSIPTKVPAYFETTTVGSNPISNLPSSFFGFSFSMRVEASNCHTSDEVYIANANPRWYDSEIQLPPPPCLDNVSSIISNGNDPEYDFSSNKVDNISPKVKTQMYPNPAGNEMFLHGSYSAYMLISLEGKVIKEGKLLNGRAKVNVSALPNGTYIMRLYTNNTSIERRVQINH